MHEPTSSKDLTPYVDSFFPERRGKRFDPIEGRNFTKETLTYMCPANLADRVTTGMVSRLPSPAKILLIEVCGGLGGNTCSFLADDAIALVITYERNENRRLMLKRNINAYHLGDKAIVPDGSFDGLDLTAAAGCGIFFDPPWLPESIPGHQSKKDDYILEGIKIGEKTLEQWLTFYTSSVYIITFRVPPNYTLHPVEGWDYQIDDIHTRNGYRGRIYHCLNRDPEVIRQYTQNLGGLRPYLPVLANPSASPVVAYSFRDPEPIISDLRPKPYPTSPPRIKTPSLGENLIPAGSPTSHGAAAVPPKLGVRAHVHPSQNEGRGTRETPKTANEKNRVPISRQLIDRLPVPSANLDPNSREWILEFQNYICELLTLVTSKEALRHQMVTTSAMQIWIRAWTHETWDSNVSDNYENIETIGDAVLGYAFKCYVYHNVPNITTAGISEYKAQYMSKMHQSPIARELKMGKWVRSRAGANVNILEDLFESFTGALHEVGDQIKIGVGSILVRNLITNLFKNVKFDPDMIRGTAKTVITQYAHRLHWGDVKPQIFGAGTAASSNTDISCSVSLSDLGIRHLADNGMTPPIPLGKGHGASEKAASDAAYRDALKNLNRIGATYEWVIEERSKISFDSLPQELVTRARLRATRNHYTTIKTVTPRSTATTHSMVVQLIGVREGKEEILASVTAKNEEEGKLALLKTYASGM